VIVGADEDSLTLDFVDPDADDGLVDDLPDLVPATEAPKIDLKTLALAPAASSAAAEFLLAEVARIEDGALLAEVPERKATALGAMNQGGFWEQPGRFLQLAEIEYLDRFTTALATARRLAERLARNAAGNGSSEGRERVRQLAVRLYVLDNALAGVQSGVATDVFLRLRRWQARKIEDEDPGFLETLGSMYEGWAERRGMSLRVLSSGVAESIYAVSGLGCGVILDPESGLHILGTGRRYQDDGSDSRRTVVEVCVAPWPAGPKEQGRGLLELARSALETARCPAEPVRRYRSGSAPLVRDTVRGYRTGRLGDVLAGDFDLFS
jgi:ATP-dependent Clp protease ATP-binding subunit ClpC